MAVLFSFSASACANFASVVRSGGFTESPTEPAPGTPDALPLLAAVAVCAGTGIWTGCDFCSAVPRRNTPSTAPPATKIMSAAATPIALPLMAVTTDFPSGLTRFGLSVGTVLAVRLGASAWLPAPGASAAVETGTGRPTSVRFTIVDNFATASILLAGASVMAERQRRNASSSAKASAQRCAGSFARHWSISAHVAGDTSSRDSDNGVCGCWTVLITMSCGLVPVNGARPASIE